MFMLLEIFSLHSCRVPPSTPAVNRAFTSSTAQPSIASSGSKNAKVSTFKQCEDCVLSGSGGVRFKGGGLTVWAVPQCIRDKSKRPELKVRVDDL